MGLRKCGKRKCILNDRGSESEGVKSQNYATKRRKTSGAFDILALPLVLIYEILSWLPIDTILICKCICKTFLQIITDPCFTQKPQSTEHRMIVEERFPRANLLTCHMADLKNPSHGFIKPFSSWKKILMPKSIAENGCRSYHIFGSCNGLVGVRFLIAAGYAHYICNPILGEYMALALRTNPGHRFRVGFGFCPKTKQYKVIHFLEDGEEPYCNVLTLGQSSWRRIKNVPYPYGGLISVGASFNGYFHWSTEKHDTEEWICTLNLENEEIKYLPPPRRIKENSKEYMSDIDFAVFDGSFCFSYFFKDGLGKHQFEICAMKDYGVQESWTKMVVLNVDNDNYPVDASIRLLNDGIVLLSRFRKPYIYYDTRKGIKKEIYSFDGHDYFPSLISLKNVAGPEKVEIARRRIHS